jgi:two-component system OmpR family sensor kinase
MAYLAFVTTGRLTRQELGWLLAQEARGAAKILRQDVTLLSQPPPPDAGAPIVPDLRVATTLNVLDDAIDMLSELETGPAGSKPASRRGRIDLAALLWEFAPGASMSIEPGAGTEVFGEDTELRRMLHVLVSQTNFSVGAQHDAASAPVRIRREEDWIRITVILGPDVSASTELERRWLSRMATRMGGRLELEGGTMALVLPADASNDQSEVADLRKELVQAQQLGEAYARELATVFAAGQPPEIDVRADGADVASRRFALLVALSASVHRMLTAVFRGLEEEMERVAEGSLPGGFVLHVSAGHGLLGELGRVATCPTSEPAQPTDVAKTLRDMVSESEARAARHGVRLVLETPAELVVSTRPRALSLLVRSLLDHAISASPRGTKVLVKSIADGGNARVQVSDGGPVVPAAAQSDLVEYRIDPASLGRPPGPALLVAHVVAGYLGGGLKLGEAHVAGGATVTEAFVPPTQ